MTKRRVLVFTPHSHPSHYGRDLPLLDALRRLGHEATYAVPGENFLERTYPKTNFPESIVQSADFRNAGAVAVHSFREFRNLLLQHDVLMMGLTKEIRLATLAREAGKFLIQHQDMGGLDLYHCDPDLLAVPGPWHKNTGAKWHQLPMDRVAITGSLQYDRAKASNLHGLSKEAFFSRYGLDPAKPLVVWLPEGPATHSPWYKERYQRICQTVMQSGRFNLLVKGHPWDYSGYGREHYYSDLSKPSWEQLTPGAKACQAEDTYACFRHCDVGLTITSAVFLDFALFSRPILLVDFQEGALFPEAPEAAWLPKNRFKQSGLQRLKLFPETLALLNKHQKPRTVFADPDLSGGVGLHYVGGECSFSELSGILANDAYKVQDQNAYNQVVEEFCFKVDGQAADRIAALVNQLGPRPIRSSRFPRWKGWVKRVLLRKQDPAYA